MDSFWWQWGRPQAAVTEDQGSAHRSLCFAVCSAPPYLSSPSPLDGSLQLSGLLIAVIFMSEFTWQCLSMCQGFLPRSPWNHPPGKEKNHLQTRWLELRDYLRHWYRCQQHWSHSVPGQRSHLRTEKRYHLSHYFNAQLGSQGQNCRCFCCGLGLLPGLVTMIRWPDI